MLASTIKFSKHTPPKTPQNKNRETPRNHRETAATQRPPTSQNPTARHHKHGKSQRSTQKPKHDQPRTQHSGTNQPHKNTWLLRKEVIQPHLPVRLPCYDLVLITSPTFDGSPTTVRPPASGVTNFHDLTGGVYKPRERIHRSVADLRLLATPTSWGRVADPNPN